MKCKTRGTFSSEITEVLAYYHAVAQRTATPRAATDPAPRKLSTGVPPRAVETRTPLPAR